MSKAVLISIQPKWCELIASGKKTIEVRKTKPKIPTPFKCYICQTKRTWFYSIYYSKIADWQGKVIGEFVCDEIVSFGFTPYNHGEYMVSGDKEKKRDVLKESCLSFNDMYEYIGEEFGYAWHISDLKIYDKPKELSEFCVIDKDKLKECPYRERIFQNPEFTNGNYLLGGYSCSKTKEPDFDIIDFCRGGCADVFKPLTRPPQSWCYVERLVGEE